MSKFLIDRLASLEEYIPGEQPRDKKYIKLNTNESPYPPSESVLKVINSDAASRLNLYPDPACRDLTFAMSNLLGVNSENIVFGNGSDEILSFIFQAFCDKNTPAVFPDISYGFYPVFAALYGVPYEEIPLTDDFKVNYRDYLNKNATIIIANPNAPTGIFMPLAEIEEILRANPESIVAVDEAYIDFGGESAVSLLPEYDNLIVVRTYSKSRSMAGARLGFAITSKEIASDLNKIRFSTNPYNINTLTLLAGKCAIDDDLYYIENCGRIIEDRKFLSEELSKRGFKVLPSCANFIFASSPSMSGKDLYLSLKERGILVRYFDKARLYPFVRITIGTHAECAKLIEAIDDLGKE